MDERQQKPLDDNVMPLFIHNVKKLLSQSLAHKFLQTADLFFRDRNLKEKEVPLILEEALSDLLDSVREKIKFEKDI